VFEGNRVAKTAKPETKEIKKSGVRWREGAQGKRVHHTTTARERKVRHARAEMRGGEARAAANANAARNAAHGSDASTAPADATAGGTSTAICTARSDWM